MTRRFQLGRMPHHDQGSVDEATIAAWEVRRGTRLPLEYRRFLLLTNGGSIRPHTFAIDHPKIPERLHAIDWLYNWETALHRSQEPERVPAHLRNAPPDHLAIGITESELMLMIPLSGGGAGTIVAWSTDLYNPWGEGENNLVVPVAPSFSAFLDSLGAEGEVYQSYWATHDLRGWASTWVTL